MRYSENVITICKNYIKSNSQLVQEFARENSIINDLQINKMDPKNLSSLAHILIRACENELKRAKQGPISNSVEKEAVRRCANVQLKYRYVDFLSPDNEDYPEYIGVWHPKVRETI